MVFVKHLARRQLGKDIFVISGAGVLCIGVRGQTP